MHHFVVEIFKIFFASGQRQGGIDPPNQNPADVPVSVGYRPSRSSQRMKASMRRPGCAGVVLTMAASGCGWWCITNWSHRRRNRVGTPQRRHHVNTTDNDESAAAAAAAVMMSDDVTLTRRRSTVVKRLSLAGELSTCS